MNQNNLTFSGVVNDSLRKLTKGSGMILGGVIVGMAFFYISRILIGRFFTPAEYGIFSLGIIMVNFFTLIFSQNSDFAVERIVLKQVQNPIAVTASPTSSTN